MKTFPQRLMILGSGELGKEVAIEAKRLGCEVIACDRYQGAPAMQVADKYEVLDMTNSLELKQIISKYNPDLVIPEIEALAVESLIELEKEGVKIIPTAEATATTMNRDKIRNLAANSLGLNTAKFRYANNQDDLLKAAKDLGYPLIIKPIMSSSGKGQSLIKNETEISNAWAKAIQESRGKSNKVIVEEFIQFELEITLLTIREKDGTTKFCEPIGHIQRDGDYQCSWQPAQLKKEELKEAQRMAKMVTTNLGGVGIFGVEFFISDNKVIFSELSPRPHDTGLVTLISQNISEFELHLRAILELPIPEIKCEEAAASRVILSKKQLQKPLYRGLENALSTKDTKILIFGKPNSKINRRMGVALALDTTIEKAKKKADDAAKAIEIFENN